MQNCSSQLLPIDSIINSQQDSLVRKKLKKFRDGGIEKHLDAGNATPDDIVEAALKYRGIPHCFGGDGKTTKRSDGRRCIDCSGLLQAVFTDAGVNQVVHGSQEIARYGEIIQDTGKIQKGDLLFYIRTYNPADPDIVITHSAIAVGDGLMVHTSTRKGVEVIPTSTPYWSSRFLFATRIFR